VVSALVALSAIVGLNVIVGSNAQAQQLSNEQSAAAPDTVERIKRSIVAVGTFQRTRNPAFLFMGTGFVVGDGSLIASNHHVVPPTVNTEQREVLVVLLPIPGEQPQFREVQRVATDPARDLAVLKLVSGPPMAPLTLRRGGRVRDGETYLFTGYPIGSVLGPFPVTHRGMIASITPIAIPPARADQLDAATIRRLASSPFPVYQLDATAYPGNSGSPLYDPVTGEVVAVLNMVFVKSTKESVLSQPSGISYAIPADHLARLLSDLR
jgi:serine protease Do